MLSGLRIVLVSAFLISPCFAQTGTVTFYSYGASVKTEKAGTMPTVRPFTGWLFDGQQRLARAQDGHFVTFHLAAGQHSFSAALDSDKPGKEPVVVTVRDGQHSCFHLYSKVELNDALLYVGLAGKVEPVRCGDAAEGVGKSKPLEAKRIDPAVLAEVDASAMPARGDPKRP
ncbi:MAG TPA: hypothetical protein VHZ25_00315 [Acidobacteriaceae bacterium]|jgi:hypothetical protein|nr:hypothetical protein [Acidobacteriaceae bacterium]